ncbi:MAG TPA: tetratricopeptide repeat protein [Thermoanaerobaculia bacterium]|jgi:tetratricopeptide (TPR) repeat protein|nr:tetratricopeptide repeat protein [Thermoanaerobaculia bacterium]
MAQAATNPKIEELRFRIKSDPKSRLFYPLAEELRKINQFEEAEQVLRGGLANHPSYLSAWVSLGRVLRDQKKDSDAAEALNKALLLDPGNVVAARLLADAYLNLGEKVEAIKKYKLVLALLPGDEELEGTIARLDSEINAPAIIPEPVSGGQAPSPVPEEAAPIPTGEAPVAPPFEPPQFPEPVDERVFDETASSILKKQRFELETGDAEPMRAAHAESPFEEPAAAEGYSSDAFAVEQPSGMHLSSAPLTAEMPSPVPPPEAADEADVFEPAGGAIAPGIMTEGYAVTSSMPPLDEADFARTIRTADLYAAEGSIAEARDIYEDLLTRDPNNASIRAKLDALSGAPAPPPAAAAEGGGAPPQRNPKVKKLESWLAKMKRGEVGRV